LYSEGYTTRAACESGIASVKKNASDDFRYQRLESNEGKPYFNLRATNGLVIGTSQLYDNTSSMENGIASVRSNALYAVLDDQT
jgi:uncharacterized protein